MKLKNALLESVLLLRINYFFQRVHKPQIALSEEPTDLNRRDILSYRQDFNFQVQRTKSKLHQLSFISPPTPSSYLEENTFLNLPSLVCCRTSFYFLFLLQFLSTDFISLFYEGAEFFLIRTKINFYSTVPSPSR